MYEYCERNRINLFEFVPLTFVLNLNEGSYEGEQAFFNGFYNSHRPEGIEEGKLNLKRKKGNPNHYYNLPGKVGGTACKYEIREGFTTEKTPYLWILKPTFYNRVRI